MGNIPLCVSKKDGLVFGEYSEKMLGGRFSMRAIRPYDLSLEDLRPILSRESNGFRDNSVLLRLEMNQELVWKDRALNSGWIVS